MMARIFSAEQKRKYDFFTKELAGMLTLMRDEHTEIRYYIKDSGSEIVEVYGKDGKGLARTDATGRSLMTVTHSILVMLIHE